MTEAKVLISFEKKSFCKISGEFLIDRNINTEHKVNLTKLFDGSIKALKVKNANSLLRAILTSIYIDGSSSVPVSTVV